MRYRWIAAVSGMAALAYTAGMLVARLLAGSAASPSFALMVRGAVVLFLLIAAAAGVAGWWARKREVKWTRVLAEQRLWESGRLGRAWLERRKKLSSRDPL